MYTIVHCTPFFLCLKSHLTYWTECLDPIFALGFGSPRQNVVNIVETINKVEMHVASEIQSLIELNKNVNISLLNNPLLTLH